MDDEKSGYASKIQERNILKAIAVLIVPPPVLTSIPGQLFQIKHDGKPRGVKAGKPVSDPETIKVWDDKFFSVNTALYKHWYGVLKLLNPRMPEKDFIRNFHSLTKGDRAFTNKHGWDQDFALENLTCGGATVQAVTGKPVYKPSLKFGPWWMEVYALSYKNLPLLPTSAKLINWTLYFHPTIATNRQLPDGTYAVEPFGQFDGNSIVPFISRNGSNLLPMSRLTPVDKILSPYYP